MGHRGHSAVARPPLRPRRRSDATRRTARASRRPRRKLIAEHGIADWSLAKRKAARQLMLPERDALPGDDEIEAALVDYHALFGGDAHVATAARAARGGAALDAAPRAVRARCWSAASRRAGRPRTATSGSSSSPTTRRRSSWRCSTPASPTGRCTRDRDDAPAAATSTRRGRRAPVRAHARRGARQRPRRDRHGDGRSCASTRPSWTIWSRAEPSRCSALSALRSQPLSQRAASSAK